MRIQRHAAVLAALLILSYALPTNAASAEMLPETAISSQDDALISDDVAPTEQESDAPAQEASAAGAEAPGKTALEEAPIFSAHIEYSPQGYIAVGTFTEFQPNTSHVQPLYSLDGDVWQACQVKDFAWLGSAPAEIPKEQTFTCLYATQEPLSSYLAGKIDRFYLKLQIALEDETTYETQTAVIDRGGPQPVPEGFSPAAFFVRAMLVREWRPFKSYGQYQLTVKANATPQDIAALLPDTLPISVQLYEGINIFSDGIVDCPVSWKPLSLPQLTAGESVMIEDAAEELIVPAETLVNTPNGIFQLKEPLIVDHGEIKLILNVVAEDAEPAGALSCEIDGLQIAFHLKPTGATAIRAYTLSEGEPEWTELPSPLLPEEVNAPSSAAGSVYTYVLRNTEEPYRSYLAAWNAGEEPVPFYVGLKVEGGVYDDRQLILAWPDTYELPPKLPALTGSGGNEGNAGSDNRNDSTAEGQRPNLPKEPEDEPDAQVPQPPQKPIDEPGTQEPQQPQESIDQSSSQGTQPPQGPSGQSGSQETQPPQEPIGQTGSQEEQSQKPTGTPESQKTPPQQSAQSIPDNTPKGRPDVSQASEGTQQKSAQTPEEEGDTQPSAEPGSLPAETDGYTAREDFSASVASAKTDSSAGENRNHGAGQDLHRLLAPAAAAIPIGICAAIAVGKAAPNSRLGRALQRGLQALHRLLHLK